MSSSRSRPSNTSPELFAILERIEENPRESLIFGEVKSVSRYYKDDTDAIVRFWFDRPALYDLEDEIHQEIVKRVLGDVGFEHPLVVALLDRAPSKATLRALGVQRVAGPTKTFYRILAGRAI